MTNVFFIYPFPRINEVASLRKALEANGIRVLMNEKNEGSGAGNGDWRKEVRTYLEQAKVVIFLQGEHSAISQNIQWEVELAIASNKPLFLYQMGDYEVPQWLYKNTLLTPLFEISLGKTAMSSVFLNKVLHVMTSLPFLQISVEKQCIAQVFSSTQTEDLARKIVRFSTQQYDIFSQDFEKRLEEKPEEVLPQIFEQYKMYQETSREWESREQKTNEFYLSIHTALLTLLGVVIGFAEISPMKIMLVFVIMMTGVLFDRSWCKKIEQFKTINTAKMHMLSLIEKHLPLRLYDEEYVIMKDDPNRRYRNTIEDKKAVPKSFDFLYCLIVALFALPPAAALCCRVFIRVASFARLFFASR